MNPLGLSYFNLASARMEWLTERQKVVAENVANADTPRFKARDIEAFSEMVEDTRTSAATKTHPGHLGGGDTKTTYGVELDEAPWAESPDGNTVVLEQQALKSAEIADTYGLVTQLYRKGQDLITLAARGNR